MVDKKIYIKTNWNGIKNYEYCYSYYLIYINYYLIWVVLLLLKELVNKKL